MMAVRMKINYPVILLIMLFSCNELKKQEVQGDWIRGTENEKLEIIERQFRGFDLAMVETGYRYPELYRAGIDENREYAKYQQEKIRTAIENGLERRPKRAESAEHFLKVALPEIGDAIQKKDTADFIASFRMLTSSCNACHALEKVPHFRVKEPLFRQSPIPE